MRLFGRKSHALAFAFVVATCAPIERVSAQDLYPLIPSVLPAGAEAPAPEREPEPIPLAANPSAVAPDSPPPLAPPQGTTPVPRTGPLAGWDDIFYLRSPDNRFNLRFTGQIQADYRDYLNPHDTTDITSFAVRRARMGLEATLFQNYEFRFLNDFGQGQTRLQDGYLNIHYWDAFQVTGGKFKQPFSYEQLIQDRFTPFMERSIIDQLVPARDVGVMIHGQNLFSGLLDYGLAVSNGEQNGDTDTNGAKDATARVAVQPFALLGDGPLRLLMFGMAVNGGNESEPIAPSTLRTPAGVPFFQFNRTVIADGRRIRYSPEVAYFYGGLGFSAQYFHMNQFMRPAPVGAAARNQIDVPFEGYYVQATYLLTGEQRTTYSEAVAPLRPFDPRRGLSARGAWEMVGRVSRLTIGDVVFAPGNARLADPLAVSDGATEMTLGFNWYLNKWVRTQFNWEHAWFDQAVRLGPGPQGLYRQHDTLQMRLQFIF
jgi:phosphate-selective porin OprO/OprP